MCADIEAKSKSLKSAFDCPSHCVTTLTREYSPNGTLKMKSGWVDQADVRQQCVGYHCSLDDSGWKPKVEACLCPKPDIFQKLNQMDYQGIEPCCHNVTQMDQKTLKCDGSLKQWSCQDTNYKSVTFNEEVTVTGSKVTLKPSSFSNSTLTLSKNKACVGLQLNNNFSKSDFIETKLFYCPPQPCRKDKPCIKQCCEDKKGVSCDKGDITIDEKKDLPELKQFADDPDFESYFVTAPKTCTNDEKLNNLNTNKCSERLTLEKKGNEISLNYGDTILGQDDYCLIYQEDGQLTAQICQEDQEKVKFKFYPIVQVTSCFFLFLTIVIYLYHYKRLVTSSYTVFMLNFATMLFLALLILAINQLKTFVTDAPGLCVFFGFVQQYFFLAAFAFMTLMSLEIMSLLFGNPDNPTRFKFGLIFGYGLPMLISIMTGITEGSAPECSRFKPRFGEETCFFTSIEAKGIWFFLPIGLFLIANSIMFTLTTIVICKTDANQRKANRNQSNDNKWDKFLVYLKLFFGMGFIWIFEIISGLVPDQVHESSWYFTDILNLSQGLYVFVCFVCKRNVIFAILGVNDSRKGTTVVQALKQRLLPERFSSVQERQTEMMSLTPNPNSQAPKVEVHHYPKVLAQETSAYY